MQPQVHHKAIIISALLTAFLLATAAGGLFLVNRYTATPVDAAAPAQSPVVVTAQPVDIAQMANAGMQSATVDSAGSDALVAAYQAQLQDAYNALQEAYGQIDQLQAAQSQPRFSEEREHDDDHREGVRLFGEEREFDND